MQEFQISLIEGKAIALYSNQLALVQKADTASGLFNKI